MVPAPLAILAGLLAYLEALVVVNVLQDIIVLLAVRAPHNQAALKDTTVLKAPLWARKWTVQQDLFVLLPAAFLYHAP